MESLATWFQDSLLPYGPWGILLLAVMDSSFVPMPAFIDLAVMGAAALAPGSAVSYAIAAVVGSTAGVLIVYGLARSGRYAAGDQRGGRRVAWAEDFLRRRGGVALLAAALMPAPFPFKVVVLTSGYLRQPLPSLVAGVATGRFIRFGLEAFLAARYGKQIVAAVQANAPLAALLLVVAVVIVAIGLHRWRTA